jgi:uncharacterized protein
MSASLPFWRHRSLASLNHSEWEQICDGCGRCCLVKLEDEESGDLYYTRAACHELDLKSRRCRHYADRLDRVADCVQVSPASAAELAWLPHTCAYRLLAEHGDLPPWHPLVSGNDRALCQSGIAIGSWAFSESDLPADPDWERYLLPHDF